MSTTSVTLTANMSKNLNSLKSTEALMSTTEYRLTTGKKVNSALDDPINYFAASDHTQKASDLQVVKDGMSEGIETINAASAGIESILELIDTAKSLAKSALSAETQTEVESYRSQYAEILSQIDYMADDSGYAGVNLLGGTSESLTINFDETGTSKITVTGVDASYSGLSIQSAGAADDWWDTGAVDETEINAAITALDTAKTTLRSDAKTLSSQLSIVTARQDFVANMVTILEEGAANLVNCDTTEESVKLTTLQTQQSLAIQSLSIATSASQAVLSLFS